MSLSAAVLRELMAAGLSGDALLAACERIEASKAAEKISWRETARAEARRRKRNGEPTNPRALGVNPRALGTNPRAKP